MEIGEKSVGIIAGKRIGAKLKAKLEAKFEGRKLGKSERIYSLSL